MTGEELEMRTLVRESDVIDRTDGSELAKAFNYLWEKYVEQEPCEDVISREDALMCLTGEIKETDTIETIIARSGRRIRKLSSVKPQEPKTEKIIKMRDATPEEIESIDKYIKSISNSTGVDFWDLEQEPCEDAISRQAVLDEISDYNNDIDYTTNELYDRIKRMPPANPQPKTGHWIRMSDLSEQEDDRYKCSHCGNVIHHKNKMDLYTFNSWCGRCGSDNGRHINYEVEE